MKHILKILFSIFIIAIYSCEKPDNGQFDSTKNGGVVITFDDKSVFEWSLADSLLKEHNWKATFCVSQINKLTTYEIQELHDLQNAGHEIAGHGLNHLNSVDYINDHGVESYLNEEIISMIEFMDKKSFMVNSFAYPFGSHNEEIDSVLLEYFKIIRGTTYGIKDPSEQDCYFENSMLVSGIGIDSHYEHFSEDYILDLLTYAKNTGRILVLYGHVPVENVTSDYQVSVSTLNLICNYIEENDMKYYTLNDLNELLE